MCDKKIYQRFKKIYNYILKNKNPYTFKTKLGDRDVEMCLMANGDLILNYSDFDGKCLFLLRINKKGKVSIMCSRIDELAIFSAIYEIECLIYNQSKNNSNFLERMLSYNIPNSHVDYLGLYWS